MIDAAGKEDRSRGGILPAVLGFAPADFLAGGFVVGARRTAFDGLATGFERRPDFFCGLDDGFGFRVTGMRKASVQIYQRFERECWCRTNRSLVCVPLRTLAQGCWRDQDSRGPAVRLGESFASTLRATLTSQEFHAV